MVRAGLITSGTKGYQLAKPLDELTVDLFINICDMPGPDSPVLPLCAHIKDALSLTPVDELICAK
jgi:hypothetical protein